MQGHGHVKLLEKLPVHAKVVSISVITLQTPVDSSKPTRVWVVFQVSLSHLEDVYVKLMVTNRIGWIKRSCHTVLGLRGKNGKDGKCLCASSK